MECNEEYIILNNIEVEDEHLFSLFESVYYVFYFQLIVSFTLSLFTLLIDTFINNYRLVKIFPNAYNISVLDVIKEDYVYQNIFYLFKPCNSTSQCLFIILYIHLYTYYDLIY